MPTWATGFIPNLPVRIDDSAEQGNGWDTKEVLGQMYAPMNPATASPGISGSVGAITPAMIHAAYAKAIAPNPWESRQYNIINDEGQDSFIQNFGAEQMAAIWAPIFLPEQQANASKEIQSAVAALFTDPNNLASNGFNPFQTLQESVTQALDTYISATLSQPRGGEDSESKWVATISDPFSYPNNGGQPQKIGGDPNLFITGANPFDFKTSWNQARRSDLRAEGRVGYSVKFVSFDSISKHQTSSDGRALPTNDIGGDAEASVDIPFIKH
jgi:hypothetical protein